MIPDKNAFVFTTRHWFKDYANYKSLEDARAVIGISGGKDSAVVAALLKEAIGGENVLGVMMPNGEQPDIQDSLDLCEHLGIYSCVVNIDEAYSSIMGRLGAVFCTEEGAYGLATPIERDKNVITNFPARLRMATLYAIANHENRRVIGTGNKAEILCGYYTLHGDGACDFDPLCDLYVDEVIELGRQLGLPDRFLLKTPNDGMSGMSDEEKLGFKYSDVKVFAENSWKDTERILGKELAERVRDRVTSTDFKRRLTRFPYITHNGTLAV